MRNIFDSGTVTVDIRISNGNVSGYRNYYPGGDVGGDMVYADVSDDTGPIDAQVILTLIDLLAKLKVTDFEGLTSVLQEFQTARATAARERRKILKEQLAKSHFISGSAVVPNLENNEEWRKEIGQIRVEFETKLNQAKTKLLAG